MLVGAGIFAEVYTSIKDNLLKWGDFGKITIPNVVGANHWIIIVIIWVVMIMVLMMIEKKKALNIWIR